MVVNTSVDGTRIEKVNVAYLSQTCPEPTCGFVSAKNRQQDRFHRLSCGLQGSADHVAAMNLKSRIGDREISAPHQSEGNPGQQVPSPKGEPNRSQWCPGR